MAARLSTATTIVTESRLCGGRRIASPTGQRGFEVSGKNFIGTDCLYDGRPQGVPTQRVFDISGKDADSPSRLLTDGETPPLRLSENLMTKSSILQIGKTKNDEKFINLYLNIEKGDRGVKPQSP